MEPSLHEQGGRKILELMCRWGRGSGEARGRLQSRMGGWGGQRTGRWVDVLRPEGTEG